MFRSHRQYHVLCLTIDNRVLPSLNPRVQESGAGFTLVDCSDEPFPPTLRYSCP